jgi:serum/glucocorticoid-regulated kinase 2
MTERKILESIAHPFIMSLQYAFQTKEKVFFIMRFIQGGELYFHLKKKNRFT